MIKKIVARIKWWRLKKRLFKMNRKAGGDVDGDIVTYNGVKYLVIELKKEVRILSTPVPDLTK